MPATGDDWGDGGQQPCAPGISPGKERFRAIDRLPELWHLIPSS